MSKLFKVLALTLFAALALSLWLSPPTTGQTTGKVTARWMRNGKRSREKRSRAVPVSSDPGTHD
jgi:hypothetical protein